MMKRRNKNTPAGGSLRERVRRAADGLKERAINMNSEEIIREDAAQEPQQEAETVDTAALQEELAKAKAQCDEYLDLAQRKQAEFANYRRRTEGVRKEAFDDGRRDAIGNLLPVIDNIERALAAAGAEESALKSGVEMVLRQTRDALTKMGVEEIDPLGQPFDAEMHNAVMQGSEDEGEPGTVCMVMQKGYKLGERVIRHAMVKVVAG
ncbi:MAG: nucleotide exchange factor GrpE [Clostridia bacterium]|nr:nucleotide exchange factor GrpE [Clostridia bacterium]